MINSQVFPKNIGINENLKRIKDCFVKAEEQIKSPENKLSSNEVLHILGSIGFVMLMLRAIQKQSYAAPSDSVT